MSGGSLDYVYSKIEETLSSLSNNVGIARATLQKLVFNNLPREKHDLELLRRAERMLADLEDHIDSAEKLAELCAGFNGPLYIAEWHLSGDYDDDSAVAALKTWSGRLDLKAYELRRELQDCLASNRKENP